LVAAFFIQQHSRIMLLDSPCTISIPNLDNVFFSFFLASLIICILPGLGLERLLLWERLLVLCQMNFTKEW